MIRIDLTAADLEYHDDQGRVAGLHALRQTFMSILALVAATLATPRPWPAKALST